MSIKIGLLGFGTVASGIPFLLKENGEKVLEASRDQLEIAKVLVKDDEEKNRLIAAGNDYNFVTNVDEILNDDEIQIVVELMGRIEPARTFITKALEAGKNVVSANKDLIATHGKELIALAQDKGVAFYYEAAVAGGIPILRTLANSLTSDKVTRILGVLNGTSNFMMTKMVDEGWSYEDVMLKVIQPTTLKGLMQLIKPLSLVNLVLVLQLILTTFLTKELRTFLQMMWLLLKNWVMSLNWLVMCVK